MDYRGFLPRFWILAIILKKTSNFQDRGKKYPRNHLFFCTRFKIMQGVGKNLRKFLISISGIQCR